MKEKPTTKVCKHCKTEIPYGAKICPQCRKKQGASGCLIVIIAFIAIALIGSCFGGSSKDSSTTKSTAAAQDTAVTETTAAPIEYIAYSAKEMADDLKGNALKAKEKYEGKYIELTGKLNVIDSDGKYISLVSADDAFAIMGVQCYIKNDDQKSKVMEMAIGDIVTLKGKITSVGEVMGYSLDIDEIN